MFNAVSLILREKMKKNDKIRIVFFHDDFSSCIDIPFVSRDKFTGKLIIDSFENVIQSYKDSYTSSNNFSATVQIQSLPSGNGRKSLGQKKKQKPYTKVTKINNNILKNTNLCKIQEHCKNKNSIITVINNDNMCLLRSVLIGIKSLNYKKEKKNLNQEQKNKAYKEWYNYCYGNDSQLNNQVEYLRTKIFFPETGCGIPELKKIEQYFKEYCITLFDGNKPKYSDSIYRGLVNSHFNYLILTKTHYNVINSMPAHLGRVYYCDYCMQGYDSNISHSCINLCKCCKSFECKDYMGKFYEKDKLKCFKCNIIGKSSTCIQRHYDIICEKRDLCKICKSFKNKRHVCFDQRYCVKCQLVVQNTHRCYFPSTAQKDKEFKGLIVFDYEAIQENGKHLPNLVVAEKICESCYENDQIDNCMFCEKICVDNNDSFCEWLFLQKNTIAIAHNAKGYF